MTNRLYYSDSYQTEFETTITSVVDSSAVDRPVVDRPAVEEDEKLALILDQSCFYPTSGGQPFDTGTLTLVDSGETLEVVDVAVGDSGVVDPSGETGRPVLHLLKSGSASLETGVKVRGVIDWPRRYDHMQQHASQHLLSHALDSLLHCETVSVHFGATESTIDLRPPESMQQDGKSGSLSAEQIAEVERYVNEVVYRNIPIAAYFVDEERLSEVPLRRPPKVTGQIRVVEIAGLDYSACGGTHCRHTGELGPIKIVKQERQRGNMRITFLSGHRALADYHQKHGIVSAVAGIFSNEIAQVPALVQGAVDQNKALEKRLAGLTQQLLRYRADELWQSAESVGSSRLVAQEVSDLDINEAKQLASILQKKTDAIVLLVIPGPEKLTAIFARGEQVDFHMGNLLRSTLAEFGGGGGGKEDFAQGGGVPASTATAVLAAAVAQVQSSATSV